MTLREFIQSGKIAHICTKKQIGAFWLITRERRMYREDMDQRVLCTFKDDEIVFKITTDDTGVTFPYDPNTVQDYLIKMIEEDEASNHDIDNILDHTYIRHGRYKHTIVIEVEEDHYHEGEDDPDIEFADDKHTFMLMYLKDKKEEEERERRDKLREEKEIQRHIEEAKKASASSES